VGSRRLGIGRCAALYLLLAEAGGVASLAGCNWISASRPSGPNVLLVTIDTLRADHVGTQGAKQAETATLDALAARGVLFEEAMASVPLTLPSHASLLTGQYPPTHGVRHNAIFVLPDAAETIAERFRAAGYATGAVVGAAVLNPEFGLAQGFDHYDAEFPEQRATSAGFFERPAAAVTDAALAWLRETDRPFFLWVHYYDVHGGYHPPEPFATRFHGRLYDGEAAYVDQQLGRLLHGLEASGRLGGTVVAVTADHGEGLGEHGEVSHTYLIYDSVLHVPLIVAGPGVPAGRRVPGVVANTGVAATLLHLAGLPPLARTDVGDLSPLWKDGASPAGGFAYAESLAGELDHGWAPIHAIRSDGFHYIRAPRPELFDVGKDPRQLSNLLPDEDAAHAEAVKAGESHIDALLAGAADVNPMAVDAETRAQIEALGYVVPKGEVVKNGADPKDVHRLADVAYRALSLLLAQKYDAAEKLALAGLTKLPGSSQLHDILARTYLETQRPEKALPHALEAARLNPHWGDFQAQTAYTYLLLGDLPNAVAAFQRASELDPKHPGAQIGLMWRLRIGGSIAETEEHARRALELGGDRAAIVERVAEVWEALGEYERALAVYQEGVKRFSDHPEFHMRLAIQYARMGDEQRAQREHEQAGASADNVNLRNRLGIVHAARKEFAQAEPIFRDILAERPDEPSTRRFLARLLRETGRDAEAQALVEGMDASGPLAPPPTPASEFRPRG
jgi:arylsulfatase A-like enzyme/Flp pilus assembly protein TadD